MLGTNAQTLQPLDGFAHVAQSIRDILTTPRGSRVLRRDYGSEIPALIDRPMNEETRLDFIIGVAAGLLQEPRIRLERVVFVDGQPSGVAQMDLDMTYLEDGRTETVRVSL